MTARPALWFTKTAAGVGIWITTSCSSHSAIDRPSPHFVCESVHAVAMANHFATTNSPRDEIWTLNFVSLVSTPGLCTGKSFSALDAVSPTGM